MRGAVTSILYRDIVRNRVICNVAGVISFIMLTTVGSYIRIPLPFTPVPITLQTFFVILVGAVLGARLGFFSQAGYVMLGMAGLPMFQGYGGGFMYLAGPTGGYLIGFIFASFAVGKLTAFRKETVFWRTALSMGLGSLIILLSGAAHLMNLYQLSLKDGFMLGVFYFIPGDFVKILLASFIYLRFGKRLGKIFGSDN